MNDSNDTNGPDDTNGPGNCETHCPAKVIAIGDWETIVGPLDELVDGAIRLGWAPDDAEQMRHRSASKRLVQVACQHNIAWTYEEDEFCRLVAFRAVDLDPSIDPSLGVAELCEMFGKFRVMAALVGAERKLREQLRRLGRRGAKRERDSFIGGIQRLAGDDYLCWPDR
jgi:hypothetical protein